jgi:hypothetical protein
MGTRERINEEEELLFKEIANPLKTLSSRVKSLL